MKNKIGLALLLVVVSIKAFSQDTTKTNPFIKNNLAIIQISRSGALDNETTTIHFDDGKVSDIVSKVYGTKTDLPTTQEVLMCIKYMKERNYFLIGSTATSASGSHPNWTTVYDYQYIFEKREK